MENKNNIIHLDGLDVWDNRSDGGPGVDFRSHVHAEYEIIYVFSGEVEFYLEGYKYPLLSESLFLTPPNNFHGWKPLTTRRYHRVSVLFMPELFETAEQSLFLKLFSTGSQFFPNTSSRNINFYMTALVECKDMEGPLQKIALKSRLISLLSEITMLHSKYTREPVSGDKRILGVLTYLGEHLREELSLDDIAARFNISKNYLNLLFRQTTGTTVNHYIRTKRLGVARQEILEGADAQEAAYNAGFNDYSNFYRAYKAFYGSIPSAPGKRTAALSLAGWK
ncbi:MAG: AraC family transcriptional regulator [Spirochaetaceae bacterium]|jgi:AraC-like DNA-binding protein|nr:AraC family transcriptional regulator [Spirochaetaceae bacterium]